MKPSWKPALPGIRPGLLSLRLILKRWCCVAGALLPAIHGGGQPVAGTSWDVFPTNTLADIANVVPHAPVLVKSLGDAAELVARWRPPASAEVWKQRRPIVEQALRRSLGLEQLPPRTPLNVRWMDRFSFGSHTVENVVFESRPGFPVTANLYRPSAPANGWRPAILSPIGHFLTPGKTAADVQARCIQLARMGFVVLAYDAIGQGERMEPGNIHHEAGYALLPLGETIAGWMVWDSMRAVDFLVTLEDVDPARIGITGNSGGGLNSLLTAALDERIRSAVVVGFTFEFGNWLKYGGAHCTCTHWPGIFKEMEWFEIAGLIAPRSLMMIHGGADGIFPISGARRAGAHVSQVYRMLGLEDKVRFIEMSGLPHAYSRPYREVMYGWMSRQLKGEPDGQALPEESLPTLPERDSRLLCDPGHAFMREASTVVELARQKAMAILAGNPRPTTNEVHRWLHGLAAGPEPSLPAPAGRSLARIKVDGGTVEKLHFSSEDGERLPGLLWLPELPAAPMQVLLIVHEQGKAFVAESGLVSPLLKEGHAVFSVDLRGRGETLGRYGPRYDTNFRLVANQVLLGEPLAGRRAFNLRRALDYLDAHKETRGSAVTVVGVGEEALSALVAALVDSRVRSVVLAGFHHSWISRMRARTRPVSTAMGDAWNDPQLRGQINAGDDVLDFGSVIPGSILKGDIPDLLALFGPRPVLFCQPRDGEAPGVESLKARFREVLGGVRGAGVQYRPEWTLDGNALAQWLRELSPAASP